MHFFHTCYLVKQVWIEEQKQALDHTNFLFSEKFIQEIAALFSESTWLLDSLARHWRFKKSADSYEWYDKSNYTVLTHDQDMVENGEYGFFYMYWLY